MQTSALLDCTARYTRPDEEKLEMLNSNLSAWWLKQALLQSLLIYTVLYKPKYYR